LTSDEEKTLVQIDNSKPVFVPELQPDFSLPFGPSEPGFGPNRPGTKAFKITTIILTLLFLWLNV